MGNIWIPPSSSIVARLAMSVMESRSSISWAEHKGSVCGGITRGVSHMAPINM
jgi:hypothetical protein